MNIKAYKKIANDYLRNRAAECSHIEYKKSELQLDKILKTICAFANNYYLNDFSFIYVGVEESNTEEEKATPMLPIEGISEGHIEKAKNTINSLRPYLYPNVRFELIANEFEGRKYLLIVVEKQLGGPFQVTERALSDKKIGLKPGRYVRIEGESRLARINEEYELLRKFSDYHFSSSISLEVTIDDLDFDYLKEYMSFTSRRAVAEAMSKKEIAESLDLFDKNEVSSGRVKNYAILMFARNPSQFIPYSEVEVITDTFGSARRMEAKTFSGPIWKQYYAALNYIRDTFMRTLTVREDGIATNRKVSNFPFKAIEELLSNAIVHKNYESGKTIQVYVTNEQINIVNYNRPLPPITIEDLNKRTLFHERDSVNPEIRDMFRDLGIIESYGTGVGEAKKACLEEGCSLHYKEFDGNVDITSVVITANPEFRELTGQRKEVGQGQDGQNGGIDEARAAVRESGLSAKVRGNLDAMIERFAGSVFGGKDVETLLGCSKNTASAYVAKLFGLGLIEPLKGFGKGKYRFVAANIPQNRKSGKLSMKID